MTVIRLCVRNGCKRSYLETDNNENSCRYHHGNPIFHDGFKEWSCCRKKSSDFNEFLNFPGCMYGNHIDMDDVPVNNNINTTNNININHGQLLQNLPYNYAQDHNYDKSLKPLKIIATPSLLKSLETHVFNESVQRALIIETGTKCKRPGCKETFYKNITSLCNYHSGSPVFHDGYKYWSCCPQKTANYDDFLLQEGCVFGEHLWIINDPSSNKPEYEWFQNSNEIGLIIYSKLPVPDKCSFEAHEKHLSCFITYDNGDKVVNLEFDLFGKINPNESFATLTPYKVEFTLKKTAYPGYSSDWASLSSN